MQNRAVIVVEIGEYFAAKVLSLPAKEFESSPLDADCRGVMPNEKRYIYNQNQPFEVICYRLKIRL